MRETKIHHRRDHRGRRGVFYFKINIFSAISANSAVIISSLLWKDLIK